MYAQFKTNIYIYILANKNWFCLFIIFYYFNNNNYEFQEN